MRLAAAGATVVVNNRVGAGDSAGAGSADAVVAEILAAGGDAVAEYSDVRDRGFPDSVLDLVRRRGRIDFLVANAAVSAPRMFHRSSAEEFDLTTSTNLGGTAHIAITCAAAMREQGFGRIVLVSSTAGLHGEPGVAAYAASKGALIAMGRTMAAEGATRGVLTNVVLPYALTRMTASNMSTQQELLLTPESVAPVVAALVDPSCTLNGQVLVCGANALRAVGTVEWGTVPLPPSRLNAADLQQAVASSRLCPPQEYEYAGKAYADFAADVAELAAFVELAPDGREAH